MNVSKNMLKAKAVFSIPSADKNHCLNISRTLLQGNNLSRRHEEAIVDEIPPKFHKIIFLHLINVFSHCRYTFFYKLFK